LYNSKDFIKVVNFSGTNNFCSEIEILQNVDPDSNGELDFFNSIMNLGYNDLLIDVGASNTPYQISLIEKYSIKAIFVDDGQIPVSSSNTLSVLGYLGNKGVDVNLLFNFYNSRKVFFKIDTDQHQLEIIKQITDVNWRKIGVIQFEYDYTHKNKEMHEYVLSKMNSIDIYYISSRGLHRINKDQIDDSLYKNLVVFDKEILQLIRFKDIENVFVFNNKFDKYFLQHLNQVQRNELVNGHTKLRRAELNIPLDTFNKKIVSPKFYVYKILYFTGLNIMKAIKKIEKNLYNLAFKKS